MQEPVALEERWWFEGEIDPPIAGPHKQKTTAQRRKKTRVLSVVQNTEGEDLEGLPDSGEQPFSVLAADVQPWLMDEDKAAEHWPGLPPCAVPDDPRARMSYLLALAGDSDAFCHLLKLSYSTLVSAPPSF